MKSPHERMKSMFEEIITKEEVKFNELEKKIFKIVCKLGCLILKMILESYDRKLMKARDKAKYRHKGLRKNTIKTIMGEVEYRRAMYEIKEDGIKKTIYLLDEKMHINTVGKVSENLLETVVEIVPITDSYRKAETVIKETTNSVLSFEAIRKMVVKVGNEITSKEQEEREMLKKDQLIAGGKEIPALFEEADGIWINLQGKDRKKQVEKQKEKCKEFNKKFKAKTELKLHVMYEGWKKDDKRHSLVNKEYIAGIMKPKEMSELRDARVYQKYDIEKIKLRVMNGDGAKWTKGITAKGGVYQKDQFHIMQEIVREVPKEYRKIFYELVNTKQFEKIEPAIEKMKYELGGEYNAVKKLNKLQSYLSKDLARYRELREVPEAPEGVEYRTMGTQESQIFSKMKKRFCSGRKAFSKQGANALAKICVLSEKFRLEELETPITMDTSVEDWIREIEENVKKNKTKKSSFIARGDCREGIGVHIAQINNSFVNKILKYEEISELKMMF